MTKKKKQQSATIIEEFKELIGEQTYTAFIQMLKAIGPYARTHRIAVVFAAMLQYALSQATPDPIEGTLGDALLQLGENPWDIDEQADEYKIVFDLIDVICKEAGMRNKRVNSRGTRYSIAESAIDEYIAWYNMQWE